MAYDGYQSLGVRTDAGVAFVTFDHPPINLLDVTMIQDLARLGEELELDNDVRAVVFDSANPDFFIAHADVSLILQLPRGAAEKSNELVGVHEIFERFRTMPKATIGKLEGIARGGGSEFLLSLDMRFAASGIALLGQPEVAVGILPGGGGTQRLPRLMGRARALEIVLGCNDFPADLAERYGYVNRALPPAELGPFVEGLAYRIASFPADSIRLAKQAVAASELSTFEGLLEEAYCFNQTLETPEAERRMRRFLELGGQTAEVERELDNLIDGLSSKD